MDNEILAILATVAGSALVLGLMVWHGRPSADARALAVRFGLRHSASHGEQRKRFDSWDGEFEGVRIAARICSTAFISRVPRGGLTLAMRPLGFLPISVEETRRITGEEGADWDYGENGWTIARDPYGEAGSTHGTEQLRQLIEQGLALVRMQRAGAAMSPALLAALANPAAFAARRGSREWHEAMALAEADREGSLRRRLAVLVGEPAMLGELATRLDGTGDQAFADLLRMAPEGPEAADAIATRIARIDALASFQHERLAVALRRAHPGGEAALVRLLASPDEEVVLSAAESLRMVGTATAVPALAALRGGLGNATRARVAKAAILAIQTRIQHADAPSQGALALADGPSRGALALAPEGDDPPLPRA